MSKEKELHTIVILVDKEIMRYFGEQKFYNGFVSQREVGDKVEMTFLTESLTGFAKFYLLFGDHAEIITPAKLVDVIRDNIERLVKKLKPL